MWRNVLSLCAALVMLMAGLGAAETSWKPTDNELPNEIPAGEREAGSDALKAADSKLLSNLFAPPVELAATCDPTTCTPEISCVDDDDCGCGGMCTPFGCICPQINECEDPPPCRWNAACSEDCDCGYTEGTCINNRCNCDA